MADPPRNFGKVACNLIALTVMGLSVSWWVLYYTDYFPVVLGLLGLGGFFAWIAFVINILTDTRKKQLQQRFDEGFLQKFRSIEVIFGILVVGWLGVAPFFGTLVIDSLEPVEGHVAKIWAVDRNKTELEKDPINIALPPKSRAKVLLSTNWYRNRDYHVKITGLPSSTVTISYMQRSPLLVPDMLLERPVILARPEANLVGPVADNYSLRVLLDKKLVGEIKDYKGQSVWIGADDDIVPPENLLNEWHREFLASGLDPEGLYQWTHPVAVAPELEIPPGATVTVQLVLRSEADTKNPTVRYSKTINVSKSGKSRGFPEELVIKEVKK